SGTSVSREDYFIRERYDYQRGANNDRTTEYVSSIQYLGNGYNASTVYTYDNRGNIRSVAEGGRNISYEYDGLNRLTRENNKGMEFTKVYEYDTNGNIVKVKERGYTTAAELGTVRKTLEYKYEETGARRDRLVKITAQNENGVE